MIVMEDQYSAYYILNKKSRLTAFILSFAYTLLATFEEPQSNFLIRLALDPHEMHSKIVPATNSASSHFDI